MTVFKNQYLKSVSIIFLGCFFSFIIVNITSAQGSATSTSNGTTPKGSCTVSATAVPNVAEYEVTWNSTIFNAPTNVISYSWSGTDGLFGTTSLIRKRYTTPGLKTGTVTITSGSQTFTFDCSVNINSINASPATPNRIGGSCEPTSNSLNIYWNSFPSGTDFKSPPTFYWFGTDGLSTTTNPVNFTYQSGGKKTGTVTVTSLDNHIQLSCQALIASTSGCFIATAVYGTDSESEVLTLRHFRDESLLKSEIGESFVETYYKYSPPIADYIRDKSRLKALVRLTLEPIVYVLEKNGF